MTNPIYTWSAWAYGTGGAPTYDDVTDVQAVGYLEAAILVAEKIVQKITDLQGPYVYIVMLDAANLPIWSGTTTGSSWAVVSCTPRAGGLSNWRLEAFSDVSPRGIAFLTKHAQSCAEFCSQLTDPTGHNPGCLEYEERKDFEEKCVKHNALCKPAVPAAWSGDAQPGIQEHPHPDCPWYPRPAAAAAE